MQKKIDYMILALFSLIKTEFFVYLELSFV